MIRIFDLVAAIFGLLVLSPLFLLVSSSVSSKLAPHCFLKFALVGT